MANTLSRHGWAVSGAMSLSWLAKAAGLSAKAVGTIANWRLRARDRYALRHLNDHYLQDIGLTRHDVMIESAKPFWRR